MITGTTNYDEAPDVLCASCGGYYKADAPESHECKEEAHDEIECVQKHRPGRCSLDSSGISPGILRCTKCSFVQTKNIISVTADTVTTVNSGSEPCPNGCGQLQPATWKALAIQLLFTTTQSVSDLLETRKRIAELESRTITVKLPDIMPPEAAPAHYWGSGESMAYSDGYNKSAADLKTSFAQASSSAGVNVEFE
ncbi:hypothetical protein RAG45_05200 [Klebsiella pneumoniae]|nr:hypothetical protein [Klebsiella pneumoniae]HBY6599160.1 hypothetical protein [Klebsiella pneumoniae]